MANQSRDELLSELSEAILHGKSDRALELLDKAINEKISLNRIVSDAILKAHLVFAEWYERDNIGSLKAWEFCFFTTNKVLKALDSRIPLPEKPRFSVVVATVWAEGHITMRDVIAIMLKAKGLRVYTSRKGITAADLHGPLADKTLRYVVLSCTEEGTKPTLDALAKEIKARRPDVKIIAGGPMANSSGADIILNDSLKLYTVMLDRLKEQ
jgi:methanogenic corrinoid protein MtbC1